MNDEETREFLKKCGLDPDTPLGPPVMVTWEQLANGILLTMTESGMVIENSEKES